MNVYRIWWLRRSVRLIPPPLPWIHGIEYDLKGIQWILYVWHFSNELWVKERSLKNYKIFLDTSKTNIPERQFGNRNSGVEIHQYSTGIYFEFSHDDIRTNIYTNDFTHVSWFPLCTARYRGKQQKDDLTFVSLHKCRVCLPIFLSLSWHLLL